MAKTKSLQEVAEMKIPVFTVLKNGVILKNIFIVNKSPEPEPLASSFQDHDHQDHILNVGRHPDCNIMLTHPSVSRFHLQIRSNPCSQELIVVDLSSVHGTWVSGRKIEPGMSVEMKEGDTLRIGASSRLYRLHWIPISRAYDLENPFVSELDMAVEAEKGQVDDALPEEEEKEMTQNESFCLVDNEEVQSVDSILESINCLFTDENLEFIVKKEIPSEDCISLRCDEEENWPDDDHPEDKTTNVLFGTETSFLPTNSLSENKVCDTDLQVLLPRVESVFECDNLNTTSQEPQKMPNFSVNVESLFHVGEVYQAYSEAEVPKETNILSTLGDYLRESICLPVVEAVQGTKMHQVQDVQQNARFSSFTSQLPPVEQKVPFDKHKSNKLTNLDPASFDIIIAAVAAEMPKEAGSACTMGNNDRGRHIVTTGTENLTTENTFLPVEEATQETKFQPIEVALGSVPGSENQINCCQDHKSNFQPYQNCIPCNQQGHSMDGIVQDVGDKGNDNISLISLPAESSVASLSRETGSGCTLRDNDRGRYIITTGAENLITVNTFLPVEEATQETKFQTIEVALDSVSGSEKQINCCQGHKSNFQPYQNCIPCNQQGHSMDGIVQDVGDKGNDNISLISLPAESSVASLSRETGSGCTLRDNDRSRHIITTGGENLIIENTFLPVEEAPQKTKFQPIEVALDSVSGSEKQINCCQDNKSNFQPYRDFIPCNEQGHSMDGIVQDVRDKCSNNISLISLPEESSITSLSEESIMEIPNKKENQTQRYLDVMAGSSEKKILEKGVESIEKDFTCSNIWSRRGKATSAPQIRTSKSRIKNAANVDNEVERSYIKEKAKAKDLLPVLDGDEEEIFTPDKENFSPNTLQLRFQKKGKLQGIKHYKSRQRSHNSENHLSREIYLGEIPISEKENQTLEVGQEQKSERKPFGSYIKLEQNAIDMSNQKDITDKTVPKNLLAELDEEEEEYHTLDKENFSPNTLQLLLLEKKGKLEELTHTKPRKSHSSNANFSANTTSGKENQNSKAAREQKSKRRPFGNCIELEQVQDAMALENRLERLPLQSLLLMNSGGKSRQETCRSIFAEENIGANTCVQILDKRNNPSHVSERRWNMVVDTASLLNKESRKAMMLLQGLKGTRLIIPRIVIKELDSMRRQFSFFRRTSEASLALEWIEECMLNTEWWIHVQSSIEEGMLIAPTPPATPPTQFNEEDWNFYLSSHKSSMEIVSPTAEDHILDYVLTYRRKQNDGQFVLLSDDVTLKIKSMAEGLLCETVEEFRDSLVNPFSERFLWADSSPRGQTWSCQDDVVLREKYCRSLSRKSSKEGAKGLKLILLHNSRYGRFNSAR